eukprot:g21359.t1
MSEIGGHAIIQALKTKHQEAFKILQLLLFIKANDKVFWVDDPEKLNPMIRCLEDVEAEVAPDERPIEEIIEEKRAALPPGGTPVTLETFQAWKERREAERLEKDRLENIKKAGGGKGLAGMSGRDLFTYDASLFKDEEGAADVWRYLDGMCQGLKALHDLRILHRDLKCANVFLSHSRDGLIAKLGDFNAADPEGRRLDRTGTANSAVPTIAWRAGRVATTMDGGGEYGYSGTVKPEDCKTVHGDFFRGRTVTFQAQQGADGRFKATSLSIAFGPGQPVPGKIKSFSERNGFGFIVSSALTQDIRFNQNCVEGQCVMVDIAAKADGKLSATRVVFQQPQSIKMNGLIPGTPLMPAPAPLAPVAQSRSASVHEPELVSQWRTGRWSYLDRTPPVGLNSMVGTVKMYNIRSNTGILMVSGYDGDVSFSASDPNIMANGMVSFTPLNSEGRLLATNVTPIANVQPAFSGRSAIPSRAPSLGGSPAFQRALHEVGIEGGKPSKRPRTETPTGQVGSGTIRSPGGRNFSEQRGFGFITCEGIDEDVFFMRTALPEGQRDLQNTDLQNAAVNFEIVWRDMPYDAKSDMWSLGCVLYEMVALRPPFRAEDMEGLYHKVVRGQYPRIPAHYGQDLADVIAALLQVHPRNRPSVEQLLQMPQMLRHSSGLKEDLGRCVLRGVGGSTVGENVVWGTDRLIELFAWRGDAVASGRRPHVPPLTGPPRRGFHWRAWAAA